MNNTITREAIAHRSKTTLTTSNQQNLIQVPSELLTSLLTSIEGLQRDVSRLRQDNESLAYQVRHLQRRWGSKFPKFPKLPAEIRTMIWKLALVAPQIHIMGKKAVSRSKINSVMESCKEARDLGLALELSYFRVRAIASNDESPLGKNYLNYDADVIWVPDGDLPGNIDIFCSSCKRLLVERGMSLLLEPDWQDCKHEHRLGGLAIGYENWTEATPREGEGEEGWWIPGSAEEAWLYGSVREVLIVVNGEEAAANRHRDIVFAEPSIEPWRIIPGQGALGPRDRTDISWETMAKNQVAKMKLIKDAREKLRKNEMEGQSRTINFTIMRDIADSTIVHGATEEEMMRYDDFHDISWWEIPSVRYVEARWSSNDWIQPRGNL